jgi:hypothetical protein
LSNKSESPLTPPNVLISEITNSFNFFTPRKIGNLFGSSISFSPAELPEGIECERTLTVGCTTAVVAIITNYIARKCYNIVRIIANGVDLHSHLERRWHTQQLSGG